MGSPHKYVQNVSKNNSHAIHHKNRASCFYAKLKITLPS